MGKCLAVSLTLMQGSLGVLQLALCLIQPPAQLLYCIILASQLSLRPATTQSYVPALHIVDVGPCTDY